MRCGFYTVTNGTWMPCQLPASWCLVAIPDDQSIPADKALACTACEAATPPLSPIALRTGSGRVVSGRAGGRHRAVPGTCPHPDAVWEQPACRLPTVDLTIETVTEQLTGASA